ncbi:hypothetical protein [Bacillus sp. OK048]|uniref:hypothetical protein n=1 Tax=Bacillus sp. OK048 TaxID=1882761 RepID=UPI000884DAB8|nr:hypothetical protein [Bacillus sp. OK048]SDN52747.1 hypothetical protein SAMN05443253_11372 [Bacillus sp. OK048]
MFWKKREQVHAEALAWFSYAVMLPDMDEEEKEMTIIGNFIIKNTGGKTLNNPIICIRTKPQQNVRLGGKIGSVSHTALMIDGTNTEAWHYIYDNWKEKTMETGEHILKPNNCSFIEPGGNLTFANELCISTISDPKFAVIEGFFYCDEIQNGLPALNNISVNY